MLVRSVLDFYVEGLIEYVAKDKDSRPSQIYSPLDYYQQWNASYPQTIPSVPTIESPRSIQSISLPQSTSSNRLRRNARIFEPGEMERFQQTWRQRQRIQGIPI
jgi:hypothetical protein